jgi:hypothetical protein
MYLFPFFWRYIFVLLFRSIMALLNFHFQLWHKGDTFFKNVGNHLQDHKVSQHKRLPMT